MNPGPASTISTGRWWQVPLADCQRALSADSTGLSRLEAASRRNAIGPNVFHTTAEAPLLLQFLNRFTNPLVIVLLVAGAVSAMTGEVTSFIIIFAIVILSVSLDFAQEYRADRTAERLRQSVAVRATVLRDGEWAELAVADVVPGDVISLRAGDLVPADGRVLEAHDLFVSQAILTGESYPVEKSPAEVPAETREIQRATNAVFMGTSVISGSATVQAVKTGRGTAIGEIALVVTRRPPPSAFETGTRRFGLLIMRLTVLLVLFVLLVNALFHRPWLESFLFAVALAVGLTPELLPMVVSVTLSRGAVRMAQKRVIVKKLAAIQNLGSMNVLCTDKTGTLTEARIRLERHVDAGGSESARVLKLAYLNSHFETGLRSPLDEAILDHEHIDVSGWTKIDEVPFDFERRRVSVLVDDGTSRVLVVKGAPEDVLALCRTCEVPGGEAPPAIDGASMQRIDDLRRSFERDGYRTLGIAWRTVPSDHVHAVVGDEADLTFAGFAAFLDPPKESAAGALEALAASGVALKIVTGDSELVTQHVCAMLGIPITGTLTGAELGHMDDHALLARVETTNLFCRMNPAQKNRIVLALRARGYVVGYLGDGINDSPPLHTADVGISVDGAADVAKEAADMILLEHDLHVLCEGAVEGRRTCANIMKYLMMATSSNFGNMFSMAGAALFLPFLPMLPTQILLNNILYDLSELPIPLDEVDREEIARPRVWDTTFIRDFMLIIGPVSSVFDFLTFYVMLVVLKANESLFHTGWFIESLATQTLVIFVIRTRGNPLASRPHQFLIGLSVLVVCIAVALPLTPLGPYFRFVAPPAGFYLFLATMVIAYLIVVEFVKRRFYRSRAESGMGIIGSRARG
ncbi:MAG: Magnesium-transporting ATPase, P-type 1 [Gammaproteobacteria bacterium]|nr:Magnesium-transporting ATPase, P-type 1 [Gammaproteobacteria bacterium]